MAVFAVVCSFLVTICFANDVALKFPRVITIGAVLTSHKEGSMFQTAIDIINKDETIGPVNTTFNATYILMDSNPIKAAKSVCLKLIPEQVYVVVVGHDAESQLGPVAISFTCGFYHIPVLGISTRDSAFSDKNIHKTFMRTLAPFSHQTEVWGDLLEEFGFKIVIMIHSSDSEGRAILGYFQSVAEDRKIEIAKTIQYTPGESDYTELLRPIPDWKPRVLLLYANVEDSTVIYQNADALGLTDKGYAWIVTEQALDPQNTPIGVFGLKQIKIGEVKEQINDTIQVIAKAFMDIEQQGDGLIPAPRECSDESEAWEDGDKVLDFLKKQELVSGRTGHVAFNKAGDRMYVAYEIVNVQLRVGKRVREVVQKYAVKENKLDLLEKAVWPAKPSGTLEKPIGLKKDEHFKVVTLEAIPFIYTVQSKHGNCDTRSNHIKCPRTNSTTGKVENFCCYGYAIDLLQHLAQLNFTYSLHLVGDGNYGSFDFWNGEKKKTWNGLIGEILTGKADMIVAPLTIDPERADVVDFSKPFKYQGLTVLVKKTLKDSSLASFLQPFQDTLWILVGLSVHVVALVLYLLDRFSPFGRYKLAKSDDTEEDALNLSGAVWFAWGVLLNSGIGEGTPRSFSARVLGMVWAGFAMIIVASYTANLAAFLVLDRPEASISGIDDARLRNPQTSFNYNTVASSAVSMYFKRQVELSTMFRTMQNHEKQYTQPEEAIQDIKKDDLQAFIWDSARLEYEAANDCDLVTAGELFGRSGYGIALAKDNPWTPEISMQILRLHERGDMEKLDSSWILAEDTECPDKDPSAATLGLTNMAGVFMMVAGGIVMGVFLIFVEIAYKRHRGLKEKELELAKTAADRWRGNIEKRRTLRRTLLQQQMERSRLTNGESPAKGGSAAPLSTTPPLRCRTGGYTQVATNVVTPRATPSPCKVMGGDHVV